jgi:CubicO group peptidase (beta-lactamase class C family)
VLHAGDLVHSSATGLADVEAGTPLTTGHLFRIASHSKTFTATAVLRLVDRGVLRLDDTVGAWVPELAGAPSGALALRALLGHASGLVRDAVPPEDGDFWQALRPFPDAAALVAALRDPACVVYGPYQRFKYSNTAYSALGLVLAAASGTDYATCLRREVIEPLGLTRTEPRWEPARAAEHATGHSALAYSPVRSPIAAVDSAAMDAATGFSSTAEDLCRYAAAHFTGDERLLSPATQRLMQHPDWEIAGTDDTYGLGLGISAVGPRRLVGHGGAFPGYISNTLFDPAAQLAVSVLTNAIDGPASSLARGLVRLVDLAASGSPDPAVGPGGAPPERLDRYCGRFAGLWGVVDVVRLGDRLVALDPTAPDPEHVTELRIEDDDTLRIVDAPGYGAPGEAFTYRWVDGDPTTQQVASVRGSSGATLWPLADYVAREGWRTAR